MKMENGNRYFCSVLGFYHNDATMWHRISNEKRLGTVSHPPPSKLLACLGWQEDKVESGLIARETPY